MSSANATGANPMRWNCNQQGCFNIHKRPKIEMFADCLPGKIAFSDVDGLVEIKGNLLALEWKEHPRIPRGQHLLFTRWTANGPATVILVVGDAKDMTVESVAFVHKGRMGTWRDMDLEALRQAIRDWGQWALAHPVRSDGEGI